MTMNYRHFGLTGPPFDFTISSAALYRGREHSEVIAALDWGLLHEPSGYTLLVGEPGTGKTTLICSVLSQRHQYLRAAYLNYPKLPAIDLFRMALRQLGIDPPPTSKLDCVDAFRSLLRRTDFGDRVALILDEAQALSVEIFEELRLLANYVAASGQRLQIVLIGQPVLLTRLEAPMLRQLNQRIGTRAILNPMGPDESVAYIEHRLRTRNGSARKIFSRSALNQIVDHGQGIPRCINVMCHNAMLAAYSTGQHSVSARTVREVIEEYEHLRIGSAGRRAQIKEARATRRYRFWKFGKYAAMLGGFAATGMLLGNLWLGPRRNLRADAPAAERARIANVAPEITPTDGIAPVFSPSARVRGKE